MKNLVFGFIAAFAVTVFISAPTGNGATTRKKGAIGFGNKKEKAAKAARERAEERAEARQEARAKAKERREEAREEAKERREEAREAAKEKREAAKETRAEKAEAKAEKRMENQEKRIQHGIDKGYLTEDEVAKLTTQQQEISTLANTLTGDGTLTKKESKTLQKALNDASRCIFGEKHDTDGKQMSVYRLGKNVKLNDDTAARLTDEDLSKKEARKITQDFHRIMKLEKALSSGKLNEQQSERAQASFDKLLNEYFTFEE